MRNDKTMAFHLGRTETIYPLASCLIDALSKIEGNPAKPTKFDSFSNCFGGSTHTCCGVTLKGDGDRPKESASGHPSKLHHIAVLSYILFHTYTSAYVYYIYIYIRMPTEKVKQENYDRCDI